MPPSQQIKSSFQWSRTPAAGAGQGGAFFTSLLNLSLIPSWLWWRHGLPRWHFPPQSAQDSDWAAPLRGGKEIRSDSQSDCASFWVGPVGDSSLSYPT